MRKLTLFCAGVLTLAACQRNNDVKPSASQPQLSPHYFARNTVGGGGDVPTDHWNGNGCSKPAHECLPPVIVTAMTLSPVRDAMSSNDPKAIGAFFSSQAGMDAADAMHISDDNLTKLASGTYSLIERKSATGMSYLLAGRGASVSTTSPEFVLQINVQ